MKGVLNLEGREEVSQHDLCWTKRSKVPGNGILNQWSSEFVDSRHQQEYNYNQLRN